MWLVADDVNSVSSYAYAARFHPRSAYRLSTGVSVYVAERRFGFSQQHSPLQVCLVEFPSGRTVAEWTRRLLLTRYEEVLPDEHFEVSSRRIAMLWPRR
jgi:hypothetical protein